MEDHSVALNLEHSGDIHRQECERARTIEDQAAPAILGRGAEALTALPQRTMERWDSPRRACRGDANEGPQACWRRRPR